MVWPAPEAVTLSVHAEDSHLEIPVRGKRPEDMAPDFAETEAAPPLKRREIQKPSNKREVTIDQASGETRLTIVDDFGRHEIVEHGLVTWECARESYTIMPDDPLSARQEIHWSEELSRGRWKVRTETCSELTATKDHWRVRGSLEAFEGRRRIYARRWNEKIERKLS
jgi:uncharacterized protein